MDVQPPDPSVVVAEPVRRALEKIAARAAGLFLAGALACSATIIHVDGIPHEAAHLAFPAVLFAIAFARLVHIVFLREEIDGRGAWARSREVARSETELAAFLFGIVPVSWLFGLIAILIRHEPEVGAGAVFGALALLLGILWGAATLAWAGDCRERLANAHEESSALFRRYWSGIAGSA